MIQSQTVYRASRNTCLEDPPCSSIDDETGINCTDVPSYNSGTLDDIRTRSQWLIGCLLNSGPYFNFNKQKYVNLLHFVANKLLK